MNSTFGDIQFDGTYLYATDLVWPTSSQIYKWLPSECNTAATSATALDLTTPSHVLAAPPPAAAPNAANALAVDATQLFYVSNGDDEIFSVDRVSGAMTMFAATAHNPAAAVISADHTTLYVTANSGNVVQAIDLGTRAVSTVAGDGSPGGTRDGIGAAAQFAGPWGITTDGTFLYIGDNNYGLIRQIDLRTTAVTTLAGTPGSGCSGGATLATAQFHNLSTLYYFPRSTAGFAAGVYFTTYGCSFGVVH